MAKKAKQVKKWAPEQGEFVWYAYEGCGEPCAKRVEYDTGWLGEACAGLIYRTKREALACAKAMLKAAKEYKGNG